VGPDYKNMVGAVSVCRKDMGTATRDHSEC
jgi:hypothetical protein